MLIDPSNFTDGLHLGEDGIWRGEETPEVSYPSGGHQPCFELEATSFWFDHRNRCIVDVVRRFPPVGAIFDIGGGNGHVTMALNDAALPTVLVEPGIAGTANATRRGVETVIRSEARAARFRAESLPAAGLFDVLEHIEGDLDMLDWLRSRLLPGGRLYLTVPAYGWLWSNEDVYAGHHRRYSAGELAEAVASTGFRIDVVTYLFSPLVVPLMLARSLPSKLGLRQDTSGEHVAREHSPPGGSILTSLLDREERRIRIGRRIPFGTSVLLAATKAPH